jgi:hypothetical protein
MDGLNLSSILNLPFVLDCLPPYVRKFWSPPLVAWKYVKTSGQEFFSYGVLGRSVAIVHVLTNTQETDDKTVVYRRIIKIRAKRWRTI